jgi:glycosyltransferase involved in cell wall biosynthesis
MRPAVSLVQLAKRFLAERDTKVVFGCHVLFLVPLPFTLVTCIGFSYPCRLMNWVFLSPIKGPIWGGMANWFRNLGVGLQERGDRCVVIGRPDSLWPEVCREAGLTFEPFRFPGDLAVWEVRRLAAILRRHQPDAGVVKGFRQARFLRYAQPSLAVAVKLPFSYDLTDTLVDRATYRFAVDRIFVDSLRTRRAFLDFPWVQENKVVAVHNGVAPPLEEADRIQRRAETRAKLGLPDDRLVVAYCGRFTELKRVNDVLDAFLRAGLPGRAECWMIGEGPSQSALESRAARPEYAGSVRFVGWVERTREWLPACDILIHPSSAEGLPNSVLEAMACGVSVIATRAGGTAEIIRDGTDGFLAGIGDVSTLAARLSELADDPGLRRRFGVAARDRVRTEFTLGRMVDGVRATMREAAGLRSVLHAVPRKDSAGWRQIRHPDFQPPDDWTALPLAPSSRVIEDTVGCRVIQAQCGDQPVLARLFRPSGSGGPFFQDLRTPPALQHIRHATRAALCGTPVLPHLAAGWRRTGLAATESLLLTGMLPQGTPAEAWPALHPGPMERRQFAVAAGWWLGRLHAAGMVPNDFGASNVVVRAEPAGWRGVRFYLLNVDDGRTCGRITAREAVRNLSQFDQLYTENRSRTERLQFLAAYRRGRGLTRPALRRLLALLP